MYKKRDYGREHNSRLLPRLSDGDSPSHSGQVSTKS